MGPGWLFRTAAGQGPGDQTTARPHGNAPSPCATGAQASVTSPKERHVQAARPDLPPHLTRAPERATRSARDAAGFGTTSSRGDARARPFATREFVVAC